MDIKPSDNINNQNKNNQNKKKRKRNIIWFNPPYSKSVKTNIRRIFIKLICKHFPPNHKFVKIFNKNIIKLSYSCMPNIKSKINGHNTKILQPKPTDPQKLCSCLVKRRLPNEWIMFNVKYFISSYYNVQQ